VASEPIRVVGLREFGRALKTLDANAPKGLRLAANDAAEFLIGRVRPLIPRRSGNAANSLTARSTRTAVRIAIGGRKAPYYPWLDFGGRVGRNRSVVRPFIKEGRYLYPEFRRSRDEFETVLAQALTKVAEDAGMDVT